MCRTDRARVTGAAWWGPILCAALATASACRSEGSGAARDTMSTATAPEASSPVVTAAPAGVPHVVHQRGRSDTGVTHVGPPHDTAAVNAAMWDVARVTGRLRTAGLSVVQGADAVRQPFMSVRGALIRVGNGGVARDAEVQVFVYGDQLARARDTDRLDPVRVAPPTAMVRWRVTPALIVDNNLALIVLASDAALRSRIRRLITGGR